jgi:hypothetical protein
MITNKEFEELTKHQKQQPTLNTKNKMQNKEGDSLRAYENTILKDVI